MKYIYTRCAAVTGVDRGWKLRIGVKRCVLQNIISVVHRFYAPSRGEKIMARFEDRFTQHPALLYATSSFFSSSFSFRSRLIPPPLL